MTVAQFVDISVFNPITIDWAVYKAWSAAIDGISRVAMRSSYGVGFVDAHLDRFRHDALAAGIDQIIFYHYSYPQFNFPEAEADWQRRVVGAIRPQDMMRLDYEENAGQADSAWALGWLERQSQNYGKPAGIYASSFYIENRLQDVRLAKFPLWLANWQYTPNERPPCPSPWATYQFVQYSDRASVPGIPGLVDADIYAGGTIVGSSFDQMVVDLWNSQAAYFKALGQPLPPRDTGIFNAWRDQLAQDRYRGVPTSAEYSIHDDTVTAICTAQNFSGGTCIWNHATSTARWL